MADLTLGELKTYADANGLTGAIDTASGTIDLAALTGDSIDGNSGVAESAIKLLKLCRDTAVSLSKAQETYPIQSTRTVAETDTLPAGVQISYTVNGRTPYSFDDITGAT